MNEIEKMYENAGIKPIKQGYCDWDSLCPYENLTCGNDCPYWKYEDEAKYSPFTAEKQLELIKWLCTEENYISIIVDYGLWKLNYHREFYSYDNPNAIKGRSELSFEESLANLINNLWQDLTEEEKQQIKEILK